MNESTKQRQNESIQKRLDSSPAMNDRRRAHCKVSCMNPLNRGRLQNEWARARGIRALAWDCGISTLWFDCRPSGIRPRPFSDTAAPETLGCYLMNGQRAWEFVPKANTKEYLRNCHKSTFDEGQPSYYSLHPFSRLPDRQTVTAVLDRLGRTSFQLAPKQFCQHWMPWHTYVCTSVCSTCLLSNGRLKFTSDIGLPQVWAVLQLWVLQLSRGQPCIKNPFVEEYDIGVVYSSLASILWRMYYVSFQINLDFKDLTRDHIFVLQSTFRC